MPDPETIDIQTALAASGDTPRPSDLAAAPPDAALVVRDASGTPFDPAVHCIAMNGEPKLRKADGLFARKPFIKIPAKGKPVTGKIKKTAQPAKPEKPVSQAAPTPEPIPDPGGALPGGSTFIPPAPTPAAPTPGETGTAESVVAPPIEPLMADQCKTTAPAG